MYDNMVVDSHGCT